MLYEHAISSDGSIVWCKCSDQIKFSIELKHDFIKYILPYYNTSRFQIYEKRPQNQYKPLY